MRCKIIASCHEQAKVVVLDVTSLGELQSELVAPIGSLLRARLIPACSKSGNTRTSSSNVRRCFREISRLERQTRCGPDRQNVDLVKLASDGLIYTHSNPQNELYRFSTANFAVQWLPAPSTALRFLSFAWPWGDPPQLPLEHMRSTHSGRNSHVSHGPERKTSVKFNSNLRGPPLGSSVNASRETPNCSSLQRKGTQLPPG
jgi:hypothetical protein